MRLALMSDMHANREAFSAALADARSRGFDRLAMLGDFVGYGADPEAVIEMAEAEIERGALALRGNHDACVEADGDLNAVARAAMAWTRARLPEPHRAFLRRLPLTAEIDEVFLAHASVVAPEAFDYILDASAAERSMRASPRRLAMCGHVHIPALWLLGSRGVATGHRPMIGVALPIPPARPALAILGAVGQPRDGVPGANYALLDTGRSEIRFVRVGYDHEAAARKIVAAGLPPVLARRLMTGT